MNLKLLKNIVFSKKKKKNNNTLSNCFPQWLLQSVLGIVSFLILAILVDVSQFRTVGLNLLLITDGADHLFSCLLVICVFSLVKCLFKSFAHFLNWVISYFIVEL